MFHNSFKKNKNEDKCFEFIKQQLQEKKYNPQNNKDLKYLLSIIINHDNKTPIFEYYLSYLLKFHDKRNDFIFKEYLFQLCELSKLNFIQILLENGIDVNCQNELGETPLHIAIVKNDKNLTNLLIKFGPDINLKTKTDNLTIMNYAEMYGNKEIKNIIKELIDKKNVKCEVLNYIKDDLEKINKKIDDNKSSFLKRNDSSRDLIFDFNGEQLSIVSEKMISSKSIKIEKNTPKKENVKEENKSNFNFINFKSPKKQDNKQIKENSGVKKTKSFSNRKEENSLTLHPIDLQSLTTNRSSSKEFGDNFTLNIITSEHSIRKEKLMKFILEIQLPKRYSQLLIENGFDSTDVLISQTQFGVALTYQNLKDIGIKLPGERSKILVHLEEKSGIFEIVINKSNIYNNDKSKNRTIINFLNELNLLKYTNNFIDNGYYNSELLYVQSNTRQPLTEEILMNDLGIDKIDAEKIIQKLEEKGKNYIIMKDYGLNTVILDDTKQNKPCDSCSIF